MEKKVKTLPHDYEAEQSVIGSILLNNESFNSISGKLVPDDFYNEQFRYMYSAMLDLSNQGQAFDPVTIKAKLEENKAPSEFLNIENFKKILMAVPTSTNVEYYADIVKKRSTARSIIKTSEEMIKSCYDESIDLNDVISKANNDILDVAKASNKETITPIRTIMLTAYNEVGKAAEADGSVVGIPTGYFELDKALAGFQKSQLIIIAARPAMGKTAFALNIAEYAALREKKGVILFSLEMSETELAKRLIAINAKIDSNKIRTGKLEDKEWDMATEAVIEIGNSSLMIDDSAGISLQDIRVKCLKLKAEGKLDMVIIDYLQLLSNPNRRASDSRQNEISEISRGLKTLAKELECPVIALSQLSREVEKRNDKRPMLSDLRESGSIEQDADVVLFLYREEYYKENTNKPGVTEVVIGKQRGGQTGSVDLKWLAEYTKFANLDKSNKWNKEVNE